ncbi:MAG: response regulator, partial [Bryobacteraceae bacterium]
MATMNPDLRPPAWGGQWGFWDGAMSAAAPPSTGNILVVDSSDSNRQAVRAALADFDYELIEAKTTSEAISAISLRHVDLVLADLRVPELG